MLLALVGVSSASDCVEGVLRCNLQGDSPKPEICDYPNSYKMNSETGKCEKSEIEGCEIPSFNSSPCLLCEKGKILDPESTKCVNISEQSKKENCVRYDLKGNSCTECENDFWVSGGTCVALSANKVENCEMYQSASICASCRNGFKLVGNECKAFTPIEGCYLHTDRSCSECSSGFVMTPELALITTLDDSFYNRLLSVKVDTSHWTGQVNSVSPCLPESVENCQEHATFDSCKTCQKGYFLSASKKCENNPEDTIAFCEVYESSEKCIKCSKELYLVDNKCQPVTQVDNCSTYSESENKCLSCSSEFYVNAEGTACQERNLKQIDECATFNSTVDECLACSEGYSLTKDNKKCLKDIENCDYPEKGADKNASSHTCLVCKENFHLVDQNQCVPSTVPNCKLHEANENICRECEAGRYPAGSECAVQSQEHCLEFYENTNNCSECKMGYYIDSGECKPKNLFGCIEYKVGRHNWCAKCESNDYVRSNLCFPITGSTGCNYSDGITNACPECKGGFYKSSGFCSQSRDASTYDGHCIANNATSATTGCLRCRSGYSLLSSTTPSTTFSDLQDRNCAAIDSTTGKCKQCLPTYQLTNSSTCELNQNHATLACSQLTENTVADLSTNTNCAECRDFKTHYLEDGSCKPRNHSSVNSNCQVSPLTSDGKCQACAEDTVPVIAEVILEYEIPTCERAEDLSFDPTTNTKCGVFYSDGKCYRCTNAYSLNTETDTCENVTITERPSLNFSWNKHMRKIPHAQLEFDDIPGCIKWEQASLTKLICIQCQAYHTGAIDEPLVTDTDVKNYTLLERASGIFEYVYMHRAKPAFKYCIEDSKQFRRGVDLLHFYDRGCEWGIKKAGYSDIACQQCKDNLGAEMFKLTHTSDNQELPEPFTGIGFCRTTDTIRDDMMTEKNIDYEIRHVTNRVRWSSYFKVTTCGAGEVPLYNVITSIKDPLVTYTKFKFDFDLGNNWVHSCVTSQDLGSRYVWDCGAFALREDYTEDYKYDRTKTYNNQGCIACKPGYNATLDANGEYISRCTRNNMCRSTDAKKYTWFSACENPFHGAWELEVLNIGGINMEMIAYHQPILPDDKIDNCIVVDTSTDPSHCRICKNNYMLVDGTCLWIPYRIKECETHTIGDAFINFSDSIYTTFQLNNFAYIRGSYDYPEGMTSVYDNCGKCKDSRVMVIDKSTPDKVLVGKTTGTADDAQCKTPSQTDKTLGTPPANCLYPKFEDSSKCHTCKSDFIINPVDFSCLNQSSYPNCLELEIDNSSPVCKTCAKSHYLDTSKRCQKRNCKYFESAESTNCALCDEFYIPVAGSPDRCQTNPDISSDICQYHSPTLGHCVVCRTAHNIPFLYYLNDTFVKLECSPFNILVSNQYNIDEIYLEIKYDSNFVTAIPELKYLSSEDSLPRVFSQTPSSKLPFDNHCTSVPAVDNCHTEGMGHGGICFRCANGFYLSGFNTCTSVDIPNCTENSILTTTCEKCADTHFLATNKESCEERVNSANCAGKTFNADTCTSCDYSKEYLNAGDSLCKTFSATGCAEKSQTLNVCVTCNSGLWSQTVTGGKACNAYNAQNCQEYNATKDECTSCKSGFWKETVDGAVACKSFNAENCAEFQTEKDECSACNSQHWKKTVGDNMVCEKHTATNCETYKMDVDECESCKQGFYKNGSKCESVGSVENCVLYSTTSDICTSCKSGYYLKSEKNKCYVNPNGINFCAEYSAVDKCTKCKPGYFLSDSKCEAITKTVADCETYSSATECSECTSAKVLKGTECVTPTAQGCAEFESETKCKACLQNRLLNSETGNCDLSGISGCVVPKSGSPVTCEQCEPGKILSEDELSCKTPSQAILNCYEYSSETVCKMCNVNHMLSVDGSSCSSLGTAAGSNCSKASQQAVVCDACHLGYKKTEDSLCSPMQIENCLLVKDGEPNCSICKSGTYMNGEGKCLQPEESDDSRDSKQAFILKSLLFSKLLLIILQIRF